MPRVALSSLSPNSRYGAHDYIRGTIVSLQDYPSDTKTAKLQLRTCSESNDSEEDDDDDDDDEDGSKADVDDPRYPVTINIEITGTWASNLQWKKVRLDIGRVVRFWLHNAQILATVAPAHVTGWVPCRVSYSHGVTFKPEIRDGLSAIVTIPGPAMPIKATAKAEPIDPPLKLPLHSSKDVNVRHHASTVVQGKAGTSVIAPASASSLSSRQHNRRQAENQSRADQSLKRGSEGKATPSSSSQGTKNKRHKSGAPTKKIRTVWGLPTQTAAGDALHYLAFSELDQSSNHRNLNLIAGVRVEKAPAMSSGTDWSVVLNLFSPDLPEPLTIGAFGRHEHMVARPEDGDVIIFQGVNWGNGRKIFTAYADKARFAVLKKIDLLRMTSDIAPPPASTPFPGAIYGMAEINYARDVAKYLHNKELVGRSGPQASNFDVLERSRELARGAKPGRVQTQVKDMAEGRFCDTMVEVVRAWEGNMKNIGKLEQNDSITLFVADYTSNDLLFNYTEPPFEHAPLGQVLLQVSIFGNQAQPLARALDKAGHAQGVMVHLRNVRPKINPNGFLEATMVPDSNPKFANRRDVTVLNPNDPRLNELKACRDLYWNAATKVEEGEERAQELAPVFVKPEGTAAPEPKVNPSRPDPANICSISQMVESNDEGEFRIRARVINFRPPIAQWVLAYCSECNNRLEATWAACPEHPEAPLETRYWFHFELADESKQGPTIAVRFDSGVAVEASFLPALPPTPAMRRDGSEDSIALGQRFDHVLGSVSALLNRRFTEVPEESWGPVTEWTVRKTRGSDTFVVGQGMVFGSVKD